MVAPSCGSLAAFMACSPDVCLSPDSSGTADIVQTQLRAQAMRKFSHSLGRKLTFDGVTETFPNDAEANTLLGREYGSRIEMPSQV